MFNLLPSCLTVFVIIVSAMTCFPLDARALDMSEIEARAAEIRAEKEKKLNELFQAAKAKTNYESVQPSPAQNAETQKLVDSVAGQVPSGAEAWANVPAPALQQQEAKSIFAKEEESTKTESITDRGYDYALTPHQNIRAKRGCLDNGRCWNRVSNKQPSDSVIQSKKPQKSFFAQ